MNETQCRMARAGLSWTLDDLASASGVNRRTILNFENGSSVLESSRSKMRAAMEAEGVVFIERGVYVGGVVPPLTDR